MRLSGMVTTMVTATAKRKRIGIARDGRKFQLVQPEEAGLAPCTGEAHSNPFIDHCMLCAPRWGQMMSYQPVPLTACTKGWAVAVNDADREAFQSAQADGKVEMVMVTEKRRSCTSSFFVWVLA